MICLTGKMNCGTMPDQIKNCFPFCPGLAQVHYLMDYGKLIMNSIGFMKIFMTSENMGQTYLIINNK
jgi:hypothetical protein